MEVNIDIKDRETYGLTEKQVLDLVKDGYSSEADYGDLFEDEDGDVFAVANVAKQDTFENKPGLIYIGLCYMETTKKPEGKLRKLPPGSSVEIIQD